MRQLVYSFVIEHGRMPMIERGEKPWEYAGWLRQIVQALHATSIIPDRWGYLAEIVSTRKLPARPIPAIRFADTTPTAGYKLIEQALSIIAAGGGSWSAMGEFVRWLAWAMDARGSEPSTLADGTQERLYRELNFESWLRDPYDYLGGYIAQNSRGGWNPNAFYPTPMSVVTCMTDMLFHDLSGEDIRLRSVCDPCVGSGRFLLAASNHSLILHGQDIDPLMVSITLINGLFYAPWINFNVLSILPRRLGPPPPPPIGPPIWTPRIPLPPPSR